MTVNLDPSIIDQDALRKQRRKKMLAYAAIPVAVLIVAGLFFVRPGSTATIMKIGFHDNDAEGIIGLSETQKFGNVIETYIAFYNSGTAKLASNRLEEAERDLRESLQLNPPRDKVCQVRVNLAYAIELRGDKIAEDGIGNYNGIEGVDAAYLYSMAQGVLFEDNCASQQEDITPRDGSAQKAKERLDQKIRKEENAAHEEEQGGNDSRHKITDQEARQLGEKNLRDGYTYRDTLRKEIQEAIRQNQQGSASGIRVTPTW
ncbi:hypothetical protein IK110_02590 [Candidatus Saccharibacteria bacterium]|nr:hypothetical protein [Candidatus Saccharibacteria bacterium]